MVDDPTNDFNRVTGSIKDDITALNAKLSNLEVTRSSLDAPFDVHTKRVPESTVCCLHWRL